jgi:hypothetical protein
VLANPRNRVVVFRLSRDEYRILKDACCARGARNISDFTRSALLGHLDFNHFTAIEQRISELQSIVTRLTQLLEGFVMSAANPRPQSKSEAPRVDDDPC